MECTPRIPPSDFQAQQQATGGIGGAYVTELIGAVTFDMADPADLAIIQAGETKELILYTISPIFPQATPVTLNGHYTALAVKFQGVSVKSGTPQGYDQCAELSLTDERAAAVVRTWLWMGADLSDLARVAPFAVDQDLMIGYEGPPITPRILVRPGMLDRITDPALALQFLFRILLMPQPSNAQARITVPSPCCVPPFVATGDDRGTFLFSQFPGGGAPSLPSQQPLPFARIFKSKAIEDSFPVNGAPKFSAYVYGGPWKAQVMGAGLGPLTTATCKAYEIMSGQPLPYNELIRDNQSGAAVVATTGVAVGAAHLTGETSGQSAIEVLAQYP